MKRWHVVFGFLLVAWAAQASGNTILRNGAIYTLDDKQPWASALVIDGDHILYVGSDAGAMALQHKDSRLVDLHSRMVLPGFHDAHLHPMTGAMRLLQCQMDGLKTKTAISDAIRACAGTDHVWVFGNNLAPEEFGPNGPTREQLDALVPNKPAFVRTADGYTAWGNSRAFKAAGINPDGTAPEIKGLQRDAKTHTPSGMLKDDAVNLVRGQIPPPTLAEYREALKQSTAMANRFGITSMFDASVTETTLDAYEAADRANELTVRMVAAQLVDPRKGPEQIDTMDRLRDGVHGHYLRADAAKIFLDGEIEMHTGALLSPYADMPGSRGELYVQPAALDALVLRLDADGFLIHMHAMGDRAVRAGLDAIERAEKTNGARDRRHQIAHVGVADPSDIPRFAALGVTANFQPLWFPADDPAAAPTETALGPQRAQWILPIASIAKAGGRIVASSDWPGPSLNPLEGIQFALTRQPLDGSRPPRQREQRIGLAAAIAAYTKDAAYVAREDAIDGTLEIGKHADLIVLDGNLFKTDAMKLHDIHVLLTLLDGKPVYRDTHFAWP